jgi:uncharacterized protein (TIGR01777 family)
VSRRKGAAYEWSDASLARGVRESDAIVHLAGENLVAKRWTAKQKQILWSSRYDTTKKLAALAAERRSTAFVSTSAIGYYGASDDTPLQEGSPRGAGFLAELCADWEAATEVAAESGVRTCIVRTGLVLGHGGALAKMLPIFKLGAGGPVGDGKQWVSWIHLDDLAALYVRLVEDAARSGIYNGTAPEPITMKEFARTLGRVLHRPAVLPAPAPLVRLALGESSSVLLTGQRVLPRRAIEANFAFQHPTLEGALGAILAPARERQST